MEQQHLQDLKEPEVVYNQSCNLLSFWFFRIRQVIPLERKKKNSNLQALGIPVCVQRNQGDNTDGDSCGKHGRSHRQLCIRRPDFF